MFLKLSVGSLSPESHWLCHIEDSDLYFLIEAFRHNETSSSCVFFLKPNQNKINIFCEQNRKKYLETFLPVLNNQTAVMSKHVMNTK